MKLEFKACRKVDSQQISTDLLSNSAQNERACGLSQSMQDEFQCTEM